jgi:hypothetical protein
VLLNVADFGAQMLSVTTPLPPLRITGGGAATSAVSADRTRSDRSRGERQLVLKEQQGIDAVFVRLSSERRSHAFRFHKVINQ